MPLSNCLLIGIHTQATSENFAPRIELQALFHFFSWISQLNSMVIALTWLLFWIASLMRKSCFVSLSCKWNCHRFQRFKIASFHSCLFWWLCIHHIWKQLFDWIETRQRLIFSPYHRFRLKMLSQTFFSHPTNKQVVCSCKELWD